MRYFSGEIKQHNICRLYVLRELKFSTIVTHVMNPISGGHVAISL